MKTVSWQSVVCFLGAAVFFAFLGWVRQDLIVALVGPAITLFTWLLQGPRSRKTGQSIFPPKDNTIVIRDVDGPAEEVTPTLVPKKPPPAPRGAAIVEHMLTLLALAMIFVGAIIASLFVIAHLVGCGKPPPAPNGAETLRYADALAECRAIGKDAGTYAAYEKCADKAEHK